MEHPAAEGPLLVSCRLAPFRREEATAHQACRATGRAAHLGAERHVPAPADRCRGGVIRVQPPLHRDRRSPDQRPPSRMRRRRHRHPAGGMPARPAMGRRVSRRPVDRALIVGRRRTDHDTGPLSHAGRVRDGVVDPVADVKTDKNPVIQNAKRKTQTKTARAFFATSREVIV